jgi:hypothetical protein
LNQALRSGRTRGSGGIGKKTCDSIQNSFTADRVGKFEEVLDRDCAGEGGERFAIFGKTKALCQGNPDSLMEAMGRDSRLGQRPALPKPVPTSLFKNLPQLIRWQGK